MTDKLKIILILIKIMLKLLSFLSENMQTKAVAVHVDATIWRSLAFFP